MQQNLHKITNRANIERNSNMNRRPSSNEIKAKLSLLGKKQVDLMDELNRIGGCYRVSNKSMLSDVINGRRSGARAETLILKILQIIHQWESEVK
jgi:hypothetical protein